MEANVRVGSQAAARPSWRAHRGKPTLCRFHRSALPAHQSPVEGSHASTPDRRQRPRRANRVGVGFRVAAPGIEKRRGWHHKMKVVSLVDRDSKQVRSVVVDDLKPDTIRPIVEANIVKEASLFTDESAIYTKIGTAFADHQTTTHSAEEYVRGIVHTNTVEGYFSVFKRGMKGVYQHCGKQHLHRYLAEFDFRYNNRVKLGCGDVERSDRALRGVVGKRLTYRTVDARP